MQQEIEVKCIDIDIEAIRKQLRAVGGVLEKPMRTMRRVLIEQPEHAANNSFIRVRDEGDRVTLTYKQQESATLHGVREIEVVVDSFEKTVELFSQAGWHYKTRQESRRETWRVGDTEVVIDERPWVPAYIEIEGPTEAAVRQVTTLLRQDWDQVLFGNVNSVYAHYYPNMTVRGLIDIPDVRFADPVPEQFGARI